MILQDGEKYACDACIKGHRVSSCHHRERPLQHVNKKGRPVSQCQHCRGLRKARATHIKCVCAEHGLKENGGDKPSGSSCNCSYGLPCTCAPKRDSLSVNTMPKVAAANLTHRRAHSYGKPVAAKRSSENILPNLKPGQHPSLHRSNHSAHEFGHPYKVRKFNASTGQLHLSAQRSLDSLPLHPQVSQTQPSTPYPSFTFSEHQEPMHIKTEHEDPAMTHSATMDAPNPFPDLNMSLMNSALSPANPARYSMNDFSNFNWPGFTSNDLGDQTSAVSAMSEQDSYDWSSTTGDSPYQYNHAPQQLHQRSSIVSLDQPGLTHSPSASTSDIGDLAMSVPDINYRSSPMASMTVDPSWMSKDADDLTGAGLNMPPYQGVTHDLVYRPSQQSAATFDDYFTAPVMNPAPSQTQADPYDESHFLTPTHERGRYAPQSLAPAVKFDDYEAWSTHLSPPDINFELQHQQQHNPQSMYPNNGQTGPW